MQTSPNILAASTPEGKLLHAILVLMFLKGIAKGFIIGGVLAVCLFLYTMVALALMELTSSIADLWTHGDSVIKLLLLCLAIYCVHKAFPYIVSLHKKGLL